MKPPPLHYSPPKGPLEIIHHDQDLLVLNKPEGLLTVPGKDPAHRDCLESRAKEAFPEARIVHRLDMDTSGVIVLALNAAAHRHVGLQFERRHLEKTYAARVWGEVRDNSGTIELPLRCDWPNRPLQMVDPKMGKQALTIWEKVASTATTTDLRLYPKTGRSHQLRVHLMAIGHPIIGDRFYASGAALAAGERLYLHAHSIKLYHPNGGKWVEFDSRIPF